MTALPHEIDWPSTELGKRLDIFQESLHCKMCKDYYDNPQILPCGHSFCCLCLTKRFDKKMNLNATDTCPQCRGDAGALKMKKNWELADIVEKFKAIRDDICKTLLQVPKDEAENDSCCDSPTYGTRSSSRQRSRSSRSSSTSDRNGYGGTHDSSMNVRDYSTRTVITSKISPKNFYGEPLNKIKEALLSVCRGCSVQISVHGDKTALEKRYRAVYHLYNAQVGSPTAKTLEQVITEINNEERNIEKEQAKATMSNEIVNQLKEGKESAVVKDGFKSLIKKAKKAKLEKKKEVQVANNDENGKDNDEPSQANPLESQSQSQSLEQMATTQLFESNVMDFQEECDNLSAVDMDGNIPSLQSPNRSASPAKNQSFQSPSIVTGIGQFAIPDELRHSKDSSSVSDKDPDDSEPKRVSSKDNLEDNQRSSLSDKDIVSPMGHLYTPNNNQMKSPSIVATPSGDDDCVIMEDLTIDTDSSREERKRERPSSPMEEWSCTICTYNNSCDRSFCEMCNETKMDILQVLSKSQDVDPRNCDRSLPVNSGKSQSSRGRSSVSSTSSNKHSFFGNDSGSKRKKLDL